jgi:transposase
MPSRTIQRSRAPATSVSAREMFFRRVFERVVEACLAAGMVGGEGFAVDASLIQADANKQRSIAGED